MPNLVFADGARAASILDRIERVTGKGGASVFLDDVFDSPDPDKALANLDRWLHAGSEGQSRAAALAENPPFCHRLCLLLGASQAIADVLVQNPDLALILGDAEELAANVSLAEILRQGRELVAGAVSFTHRLDRLRYLKQRLLLGIVWNDLAGIWEPERVWQTISLLADGILQLAVEVVCTDAGLSECPIGVVALGKHGSKELNYSSDIDLMFVVDDSCDDVAGAALICERLKRALEGKMGRGALYRIDLRLRPMGKTGPIVQRVGATLSYYENYAEPWETMAMIRSRACAGDLEAASAFVVGVAKKVYRGARSEMFFESVVAAKARYEAEIKKRGESETNIKLGRGGIRDIEFVVQLRQLAFGHEIVELQGADTASAISILVREHRVSPREASLLSTNYRFLRQVEHRIQLRYDLQAHTLPKETIELEVLGRMAGFADWPTLDAQLKLRRQQVRELLESHVPALRPGQDHLGAGAALGLPTGSPEADAADKMVSLSDEPEGMLRQLAEDPSMADRLRLIAGHAPRMVPEIVFHQELWDVAFSEEIELVPADEISPGLRIAERLASGDWEVALAGSLRREAVVASLKEAHHTDVVRTFAHLTAVAEAAIPASLDKMGGADVDVLGLGRLGAGELLLASDWDLVLLSLEEQDRSRAERVGEEWMRIARRLAMNSGYFPADTRLRPEGSSGLVVRSLDGFLHYARKDMEPWERLAYTRARSLRRVRGTEDALNAAIFEPKWDRRAERDILHIRNRIRTERMRPWEGSRDLKLGEGMLLDIEWLCAILRLRTHGAAAKLAPTHKMTLALAGVSGLTSGEAQVLSHAALTYARIRNVLYLLDLDSDSVLPENPGKLDRIAASLGVSSGNNVLLDVEEIRKSVAGIFEARVVKQ